ncbi:MAG: hypothetical protein LWW85_00005, partial [Marinilabiliales bacterium]|nr:hypothetical protein [Marinilabiliales bacterium]
LTKYNEPVGLLTVTGPKTLVLPADAAGPIVSATAETVTLAKHDCVIVPAIAAVKYLTLGAINAAYVVPGTVVTASISGKVTTAIPMVTPAAVTVTSPVLTTLTLGGTLSSAVVATNPLLTSLTTSGVINSLTVNGNAIITGLNLAHTHYVGGPGSTMIVNANPKLTSLTTSVDKLNTLTVTNNVLLTSCNFASYVTPLLGGTSFITIGNNKLTGDFAPATAATLTTPYIQTVIKSADLKTLSAYVAATKAQTLPAPVALVISVDVDNVSLNGAALPSPAIALSTRMALSDPSHLPAYLGANISTAADWTLIQ